MHSLFSFQYEITKTINYWSNINAFMTTNLLRNVEFSFIVSGSERTHTFRMFFFNSFFALFDKVWQGIVFFYIHLWLKKHVLSPQSLKIFNSCFSFRWRRNTLLNFSVTKCFAMAAKCQRGKCALGERIFPTGYISYWRSEVLFYHFSVRDTVILTPLFQKTRNS